MIATLRKQMANLFSGLLACIHICIIFLAYIHIFIYLNRYNIFIYYIYYIFYIHLNIYYVYLNI